MSTDLQKLLSTTKLASLKLRNRVSKTATFEGMPPEGEPTEQHIDFHTAVIDDYVRIAVIARSIGPETTRESYLVCSMATWSKLGISPVPYPGRTCSKL